MQLFFFIAGDEILELNGESLHGLTHEDALQKFKVSTLITSFLVFICMVKDTLNVYIYLVGFDAAF